MPRRIVPVVLVVLALTGVPSGGRPAVTAQEATPTGTAAPDGSLARTNVRYFLPYNADGLNPDLTVLGEITATCDTPSSASPGRPDARRCGPGLDPCFENPRGPLEGPPELACPTSPFGRDVTLVTVTEPLPRVKPDGQLAGDPIRRPWALELVGGVQCELLGGATFGFVGMRMNYGCTDGGWVLGEVDASQPFWAVTYLAPAGIATELRAVTTAWI